MSTQDFKKVCKVNGCPLRATLVTDYYPMVKGERVKPKWGICRYHAKTHGKDWAAVTARIQRYSKISSLVDVVQNRLPEDIRPLTFEAVQDWLARVNELMRFRIIPGYSLPDPDSCIQTMKGLLKKDD